MATCVPFARLAHYLCKFSEGSQIFFKNGFWQMLGSLTSTYKTAWRMLVSLASPNIFLFLGILYLPKLNIVGRVLPYAKFACEWPLLSYNASLAKFGARAS